ncbi:MFS general substrate transporter [Dendrothele bispora CBS 962.96]|uniref:MFS general substrate transporter n=1 Tax=Dendrothele bispora (strain CBS 962.96) TaxID=1314807 RepID=A0A4S8MRB1_DENBC|nr:MFS general substrate transporter [Dendrothele bispora CBS 962.96]
MPRDLSQNKSMLQDGVPEESSTSASEERADAEGCLVTEKQVVRRVDLRMLPLLGMLYSLALIDRTNLGIARIAGMGEDLVNLLREVPSNAILRVTGSRNLLTFCVVTWGAVQLSMAFVPNWRYLVLCRVLLGTFEAGFFPALVFIITTWLVRNAIRNWLAAFYITSILIGGFSAIFAYGLSFLAGIGGLGGWSWIFIVEGGLTLVFGFVAYFYLPEFPDNNTFLSLEETQIVLRRIENDRCDSMPDQLSIVKVLHHLLDWKVWIYGIMYMCATIPAYAIGFFVTIILSGMGWDLEHSLLLSSCPYVFAAASVFIFARLSDRSQKRAYFISIQVLMTLVGFILTGFVGHSGWRYFGLFLGNAGSAGCIPGILGNFRYLYPASNNVVSHSKRAITTALVVSFGGVGGIIATTVFREQDYPRYIPGVIVTISSQVLFLFLLAGLTVHFHRKNRALRNTAAGVGVGGQPVLYTL